MEEKLNILAKITMKNIDSNLKNNNENIGYIVLENGEINLATATLVNNFGRAMNSLTTQTFADTILTAVISTNEAIKALTPEEG